MQIESISWLKTIKQFDTVAKSVKNTINLPKIIITYSNSITLSSTQIQNSSILNPEYSSHPSHLFFIPIKRFRSKQIQNIISSYKLQFLLSLQAILKLFQWLINYFICNIIGVFVMNIQNLGKPSKHTFTRPQTQRALNKGSEDVQTSIHLQTMQKKAALYNIKNQLLKYENFQGVSNEQLQNLLNNLQQQPISNKNQRENGQERDDADLIQVNSSGLVRKSTKPTKTSLLPIDKKGLLRFSLIALVVLCVFLKLSQTNYKQYNLGQFSIYSTKYDKSPTQMDILQLKKTSMWGHLAKLLGGSDQDKIKLYLPNSVPRVKIYDLHKLNQEECLMQYRPVCLDYRLTTFGSMNIELQACILGLLAKPQNILFEGKVDNFLPILVAGEKLKRMQLFSQQKYQVTVLESDQTRIIEMNALKLSIIDSNLQNQMKIFRVEREKDIVKAINQHQYAIVSQKLFKLCLDNLGSDHAAVSTIFIINLPQGITHSFQQELTSLLQRKLLRIDEIVPSQHQQKDYEEVEYVSGQASSEQFYHFSRIFVVKILAKLEKAAPKVEVTALIENKQQESSSLSAPQQQSVPSHHLLRKLGIRNHPCIALNTYKILPINSIYPDHQYVTTVIGFRLLVKNQVGFLYHSQGALSPELLFFIAQNIKTQDKVFIANQLFVDELIVLTLANTIRAKPNLHCVYAVEKHETLTQNLRINSLANFVTFSYLNKDDQQSMASFYKQNNFTVFFTSVGYFSRDYTGITILPTNDRLIIFLWNFEVSHSAFMRKIASLHQVWVILQRSDKIQHQNTCLDYALVPFKAEDVGRMRNVWVVAQI